MEDEENWDGNQQVCISSADLEITVGASFSTVDFLNGKKTDWRTAVCVIVIELILQ